MIRYTAMVRLRKGKTVIHQENKTFAFRAAAFSWAKHREVELEKPGALEKAQQGEFSFAGLIRWYIDSFFEISGWQRTKQTSLEFLENHSIGEVNVLRLTAAMLIDHVRARRADGAGPATVAKLYENRTNLIEGPTATFSATAQSGNIVSASRSVREAPSWRFQAH